MTILHSHLLPSVLGPRLNSEPAMDIVIRLWYMDFDVVMVLGTGRMPIKHHLPIYTFWISKCLMVFLTKDFQSREDKLYSHLVFLQNLEK